MSPMVERAAKAAYLASILDGKRNTDLVTPWENCPESVRQGYRVCVRAAIEAMREPTDEMLAAAASATFARPKHRLTLGEILKAEYRAAVAAALKDSA